MIFKAISIALRAHHGQVDKAGKAYFWHPFTVARKMKTRDEFVTAMLHDVMEDSSYTADDLRAEGIPEHIMEALTLLTHDKSEGYFDYILKIKENPLAKAVKLGDLQHNSDLSRLTKISSADVDRVNKYRAAMAVLKQ